VERDGNVSETVGKRVVRSVDVVEGGGSEKGAEVPGLTV
jgi:hypothetical protein